MTMTRNLFVALGCALLLTACGGDDAPASASTSNGTSSASVVLDKDPGEAKSIFEVRKMEAGQDVVAVGRVHKMTKGAAALLLIDASLQWCNTTNTPWDFCCHDPEERGRAVLPVEVRRGGEVVDTNDFGIRPLDVVVVAGKLEASEGGGLVLVTDKGWFRRERPDLGDRELAWP